MNNPLLIEINSCLSQMQLKQEVYHEKLMEEVEFAGIQKFINIQDWINKIYIMMTHQRKLFFVLDRIFINIENSEFLNKLNKSDSVIYREILNKNFCIENNNIKNIIDIK